MFPWVYGFEWNAGTIIFLGLFFTVVTVIATTVTVAVVRSLRTFREHRYHQVGWEAQFEDLGSEARPCRHQLAGETGQRMCRHGFECNHCEFHRKMLDAAPAEAGKAPDRYFHRGHAWVRPEDDGTVTIGIDDFGAKVVGTEARAKLPKIGRRVHENGTAWRFLRGDESVRVLAPVTGEVVAHGGREQGWYLRVKPLAGPFELGHLLKSDEVGPWMEYEMARLLRLIPKDCQADLTRDDRLVDDVTAHCRGLDWDVACAEILLEP